MSLRTVLALQHCADWSLKFLLNSCLDTLPTQANLLQWGKSNSDFLNKLKVVDEEADESLFWLEFIKELEIDCDKIELEKLIKESDELVSIFSSAIRTIKEKNNLK